MHVDSFSDGQCRKMLVLCRPVVRLGLDHVMMPMIPELTMTMLACTRIGAVQSKVFAGFLAKALIEAFGYCW
jgi:acyl-coenzyme A synthetase/AMP-(fatty) acid ligase